MSDTHAALRAFCAEGPIDWPAADGIAINAHNAPVILVGAREVWVESLGIELAEVQPRDGDEVAALVAAYRAIGLTPEQAARGLAYLADHGALFAGRHWRDALGEGELGRGRAAGAALVAAVRALLAERDRLVARQAEVHAEIAAILAHHEAWHGAHAAHLSVRVAYGELWDWRDQLATETPAEATSAPVRAEEG